MANEFNLVPPTKEQARERGAKGGRASAKAKKERKAMAEAIKLLLSQPCNLKDGQGNEFKAYAKMFGLEEEDIDNQMAVMISMFKTALSGNRSSVSAAIFLRDTIGEKPIENINANIDANLNKKKDAISDVISQMKSVDE